MSNLIYLVQWQGKNCLCVCHNDHQLFGIGYHFKIFRSQVASGKKKLILHPASPEAAEEIGWLVTCPFEEVKKKIMKKDCEYYGRNKNKQWIGALNYVGIRYWKICHFSIIVHQLYLKLSYVMLSQSHICVQSPAVYLLHYKYFWFTSFQLGSSSHLQHFGDRPH